MSKTVKSGRLIVMGNGEKKIIELRDGGGTRTHSFEQQTTTFGEIHQRLRRSFDISKITSINFNHTRKLFSRISSTFYAL